VQYRVCWTFNSETKILDKMAAHCDSVLEPESTRPELDSRLRGNDNFKAGPCTLWLFVYGVNQCNSVSNPDFSEAIEDTESLVFLIKGIMIFGMILQVFLQITVCKS